MRESVLFVDLGIDATNQDIIDQMKIMKTARETKTYQYVVCSIRGFGNDKRELYEIPEVRAFCRRLVSLGFISYLDFTTFLPGSPLPDIAKIAWAAAEVWLCSENRFNRNEQVTPALIDEIANAISESNTKADATLGPYRSPR